MASDVVKTKELPVVDQYTDVSLDDRVVASHIIEGEERETVAITVGALGEKFLSEANTTNLFPRNYFGTTVPSDDFGNNGDLYFLIVNNTIDTGYYKMNDSWKSFKLGDGWDGFLSGTAFDLVSKAETIDNTAVKNVFQGNTLLRKVVMPKCKTVPANTFKGSYITYLSMPEVETIGDSAFQNTTHWERNTPDTPMELKKLKTIGDNAFDYFRITDSKPIYMDISNVEDIGDFAFWSGVSFIIMPIETVEVSGQTITRTNIILPKCKTIGEKAFGTDVTTNMRQVHYITLERIESIDDDAFVYCEFEWATESDHARIIFGSHITHIGTRILREARKTGDRGADPVYTGQGNIYGANLDMYVKATTPPTLDGLFDYKAINVPGGTDYVRQIIPNIYVPEGSVNLYKSATNWSAYADYIQAIPPEGIPGYDN